MAASHHHLARTLHTGVVTRLSLALALLAALCDAHHGLYFASVTPSSVPAAGVKQDLTLIVTDGAGRGIPRSDLRTVHERLLHVMVLGADWATFAHIHPEEFPEAQGKAEEGRYGLQLTFPAPGTYLLMIELAVPARTEDGELQVIDLTATVTVGDGDVGGLDEGTLEEQLSGHGSEQSSSGPPSAMAPISEPSAKYRANLRVNGGNPTFVGSCVALEMTYTTAGGGEVTDLAPYLGAAAHVAVVHESMSSEMEGLMTHTHAMPSDDTDSMGGMAHSASPTMDPCAMDVQNMPVPPARFGSRVIAYARFPRPGAYAVVSGVRRADGETLFTRFVLRVLEVPVQLYTNPEPPQAGEPAELEVRLAAQDIWGASPAARLSAVVVHEAMRSPAQHLPLRPSPDGLADGLRAPITFPLAGKYHLRIHGALVTDTQTITIYSNHTLQVGGQLPKKATTVPLTPSPMAKFPDGPNVAIVRIAADGTRSDMSPSEISGFQGVHDSLMVSMEVNGGGVVLAGHCTTLKFRVPVNKANAQQLQTVDGLAGRVAVRLQGAAGTVAEGSVEYASALPMDARGILLAEGYGADSQLDLMRRLCTPLSEPVRAAGSSNSPTAMAFVTFPSPGTYAVEFTFQTASRGEEVRARFVMQVCPDTAEPILWSGSCAWAVQPTAGDRVLVPGGRHIVLDTSTPPLAEVVVHGTLEVAATQKELILRAGRVAVDLGGRFMAGNDKAPLLGRFSVLLNRGDLSVLGPASGPLGGSALFGVGAGTVSFVGAKDAGQAGGTFSLGKDVAAGSKQLVVPGAPWKAGATLLISDALGSAEYHAETVLVAAVRAGKGAVTLSTALKHDYVAGATVALLSRSITVTSEQYADGGASIKIAPPSPSALQNPVASYTRRRLMDVEGAEEALGMAVSSQVAPFFNEDQGDVGGGRHLLHSDPTAGLSRAADFMVAGGGDGGAYFVVDATTDVLFDGVEFDGLGRLGDGFPALSLLSPEGTCPFGRVGPLSRPPRVTVRGSAFHSLHSSCVHVGGFPVDFLLHSTVCHGAKGDGVSMSGEGGSGSDCDDPTAPTSAAAVEECVISGVRQSGTEGEVMLRASGHPAGVSVRGWSGSRGGDEGKQLRINGNIVAGSQGDGFALRGSAASEFKHNIAHHSRGTGLLHAPLASADCPLHADAAAAVVGSGVVRAVNLTMVANGRQQVCAAMDGIGLLLTEDTVQLPALPTALPAIPPVLFLDPGVWSRTITIRQRPVDTLQYFRIDVPEDAAVIKLMVDQLQGNVDILINPSGGAPCHSKFDGCQTTPANQGSQDRTRIRGIGVGFSATPSEMTMLTLPLPAYATGTWIVAVGCKDCAFRIGLNVTACGAGWAGFPSDDLELSPSLAADMSPEEALEQAGQNFTCVPLIDAVVNEPQRNLTLEGSGASVFLRTTVREFTSQLWTRVRRVSHSGPPSSLHFRTFHHRLPTFSPGRASSAHTMTAKYDVLTPAPDVREDQELEDVAVPLDHFSQMMMFLKPGTYFTTVTQAVTEPDADHPATAGVEVEVGTVSCETGSHVSAEPYFFPPHHVEDMVAAARDGPVKRACNIVITAVKGRSYAGPQAPAQRYGRLAGETRGGRTTVFLIDVPRYSSRLRIDFATSQGKQQPPARAEMYLRHGVPPVILDQEDYVQWDYDRYTKMQDQTARFDLPWFEVYERWGPWYVVVDWLTYNADGGQLEIHVDTGGMPACPGDPSCSGNGVCWSVDGRGVCQCNAGWSGDDCHRAEVSSIEAAPEPTEADDELATDDAKNALGGSEAELAARIATLEAQLAESEAAKTGLSTQLDAALEASETTKAELSTRLEAAEKDKVGLAAQLAAARATVGAPSPTPSTPKAAITHELSCAEAAERCGSVVAVESGEKGDKSTTEDALRICRATGAALRADLGAFEPFGGIRGVREAAAELTEKVAEVGRLTAEVEALQARHCDTIEEVATLREGFDRNGLNPYRGPLIALALVLALLALLWTLLLLLRFFAARPTAASASAFHRLPDRDRESELTAGTMSSAAGRPRGSSPPLRSAVTSPGRRAHSPSTQV